MDITEYVDSARKLVIGIARATKSSLVYGDMRSPEKDALALGYITLGVSMAVSMGVPKALIESAAMLGADNAMKVALRQTVDPQWFDKTFEEYGLMDLVEKMREVNSTGGES